MLKRFFLSEKAMLTAIVINAIIIFFMSFPQWAHVNWLVKIDFFFILFFMVEAIVKIAVYKGDYFKSKWNLFDFTIVLVSLPSILSLFMPIPDLSVVLLLRLLRLLRLIRFLVFIPHLKQLLEGLGRAFKASVFVLLALVGLNFLIAIFTTHLYGTLDPENFGDPLISSYTVFQLFTIEGWNEIPTTVLEKANPPLSYFKAGLTRFYFAMVVMLGGIFGLSIANAVFVDEMMIDNNRDLEEKVDVLQAKIDQLQELIVQQKTK